MKNVNYTIRPPKSQAEWDVIPGMLREYHKEFDDDTCFTSFDAEMADLRQVYTMPGSHLIVAIENTDRIIAGCVAMRTLWPGVAEMKRLYVSPLHRGHQLGKQLAVEIILYAAEIGYKSMLLDTMHEMQSAQKLYQALGFTLCVPYNSQDTFKVVCYEKKFI
ncbi:MAG: GNAT family N-acetyltransferase [Saprospiraceae bacterium]